MPRFTGAPVFHKWLYLYLDIDQKKLLRLIRVLLLRRTFHRSIEPKGLCPFRFSARVSFTCVVKVSICALLKVVRVLVCFFMTLLL